MIRIVMIVIKLLPRIPYWLLVKLKEYKNFDKHTAKERYQFVQEKVELINKKARVEVQAFGLENLPEQSGYLLTPNHQGLEDPLAIVQTHPKVARAIVKKELRKVPVIHDIIEILDCIYMDRSDVRGSVKIIREATNALKQGENFFVFPEGTRSKQQNNIIDFKGGTFKIATGSKAPIVPVAIIDAYRVFDEPSLKKITVQIHYLPALYYDDYKDMQTNDIAQLVHDQVETCIKEHTK